VYLYAAAYSRRLLQWLGFVALHACRQGQTRRPSHEMLSVHRDMTNVWLILQLLLATAGALVAANTSSGADGSQNDVKATILVPDLNALPPELQISNGESYQLPFRTKGTACIRRIDGQTIQLCDVADFDLLDQLQVRADGISRMNFLMSMCPS
jgi:hypothetical protein